MTKTGDFLRSLLGWDSDSADSEPIIRDSNQMLTRGGVTVEPFAPQQTDIADIVDEIRYLDELLERGATPDQFIIDIYEQRKILFNALTDAQITDAIRQIYAQEKQQAGLFALYRRVETSDPIVRLQTDMEFTHDITAVGMPDSVMHGVEEYQLNEHVHPVEQVVDVVQESVTKAVRRHLANRARLAYGELPVSDAETGQLESTDQIDAAISSVWENNIKPTDAVINDDGDRDQIQSFGGVEVHDDVTDTVDVPYIVADSNSMGYEIVQQDVTVEPSRQYNHHYTINWTGFFECVNPDALAVAE
jgi:hypothetical protein